MKNHIYIKALNRKLEWNQSIASLMKLVSYNIDYTNNEISLYISRGILNDSIEFIRGNIGTFKLDRINNEYFNKIEFVPLTEEEKIWKEIRTWYDKTITVKYSGKNLKVNYAADNPKVQTFDNLISSEESKLDLLNLNNWKFDLSSIRSLLKSEFHQIHYDYNYKHETEYTWLHFKNLKIFGLSNRNFSAYYDTKRNEIQNIGCSIGTDEILFEATKSKIESKLGKPSASVKSQYDEYYKHNIRNEKWNQNNLIVSLYSTIIGRAEVMTYNLKIEKTAQNKR